MSVLKITHGNVVQLLLGNLTERNMKEINLVLTLDEVNAILAVLGDLPTKSGSYPLIIKIKGQADPQVKDNDDGKPKE